MLNKNNDILWLNSQTSSGSIYSQIMLQFDQMEVLME